MRRFVSHLNRMFRSELGVSTIEYAVVLALIGITCINAVRNLGNVSNGIWDKVALTTKTSAVLGGAPKSNDVSPTQDNNQPEGAEPGTPEQSDAGNDAIGSSGSDSSGSQSSDNSSPSDGAASGSGSSGDGGAGGSSDGTSSSDSGGSDSSSGGSDSGSSSKKTPKPKKK